MSRPLRIAGGVLFHPESRHRVGGFVSYSARFTRRVEAMHGVELVPIVEPAPGRLPHAEITAPHLHPFGKPVAKVVRALEGRLRAIRPDAVLVMEWGSVGSALFEACIRVGVPYAVLVIDHKPVCTQAMLLEGGERVCEGPTVPERCADCLSSLGWRGRTPALLALRQAALAYYFRRAAAVVAFTPQHADEVARWLGRPRESIDVVPIAVPPAGDGYAKSPDAFARPLRFGFVARTAPEWGIRLVLDAWRRLAPDPRDAVLDIHTSHEWEEEGLARETADLVARGSVTVDLEPVFERLDEVHARLAALIVASQWKNNISGAGLEALQRGTPVITSDRYAFYESLPRELQELAYRFGDAGSLAEVLGRLIADPAPLAERARLAPAPWSEADHVGGVVDVLRRAAQREAGPAAALALPVDEPAAVLVARGPWQAALDAYLAGAVETPPGGLVVVGDVAGFEAVEQGVLERLDAAGIDPADCPPLALLEAVDPTHAIAAAAALVVAHGGEGTAVARACNVRVVEVARAVRAPA